MIFKVDFKKIDPQDWEHHSVVQHLPSMCDALGSSPSPVEEPRCGHCLVSDHRWKEES